MGIKDLWTILTPYCERKPLSELEGQTIAIDLSCWICESQSLDFATYAKLHLRNLFFRAQFLLMNGIRPIFVLEGECPELKKRTVQARAFNPFRNAYFRRTASANGGDRDQAPGSDTGSNLSRVRFQKVLRHCKKLLKLMGVECLQAVGEAEAACAYLNNRQFVNGCVTQDSDSFAYGAQTVYRNFALTANGKSAHLSSIVEVYDLKRIRASLNDFGRRKIIAFALFCGCDYDPGITGVGKESVMKLLNKYTDEEILEKLRLWRARDSDELATLEMKTDKKLYCTMCGHRLTTTGSHRARGCFDCGTSKDCHESLTFKSFVSDAKNEIAVRKKALANDHFPNEKVIAEFLTDKDVVSFEQLQTIGQWSCPDLEKFIEFASLHLEWDGFYAFEKIFPVLTRWRLLNPDVRSIANIAIVPDVEQVQKKRNLKGKQCYQILWRDSGDSFGRLLQEMRENRTQETGKDAAIDLQQLWTTVEPETLVEKVCSRFLDDFRQSNTKSGRKTVKRPRKPEAAITAKKPCPETNNNAKTVEEPPPKPRVVVINLLNDSDGDCAATEDAASEESDSEPLERSFFFENDLIAVEPKHDLFEKSCDPIIVLLSDDDVDDDDNSDDCARDSEPNWAATVESQ